MSLVGFFYSVAATATNGVAVYNSTNPQPDEEEGSQMEGGQEEGDTILIEDDNFQRV